MAMSEEVRRCLQKRKHFLNCSLCHKFLYLRVPTIIIICLHAFCRKCILEKLDEASSCPVCDVDLGCIPKTKLLPIQKLQETMPKKFPRKKVNVGVAKVMPSVSISDKRKERSASPLFVDTLNTRNHTTVIRKITTYRKAGGLSGSSTGSTRIQRSHENYANHEMNLISMETLARINFIRRTRKTSSKEESFSNPTSTLTEANYEELINKMNSLTIVGSQISSQALIDVEVTRRNRRINPLWLKLVAYNTMKANGSLPQISTPYLRIKDANQPISLIQKYLSEKLNLENENEVEILCCGWRVSSTLSMHELIDLWPLARTSKRMHIYLGDLADDFVIILSYRRKVLSSAITTPAS